MRTGTCAALALLAAGGSAAFSVGPVCPHGNLVVLRAAEDAKPWGLSRRGFCAAGGLGLGLAQLAAPPATAFDFRKAVTGEEAGKERASVRMKQEAEANKGGSCDTYECYQLEDDNDSRGDLARVDLDGISILAPSEGNANGFALVDDSGLASAWKDSIGAFVEVKVETTDKFGFEMVPPDKLPPPPLGGITIQGNVAGVGALVARERSAQTSEKQTYVNGRARLLQDVGVVVYVLGLKNAAQTVLVAVLQKDGKTYQVSCGAPTQAFKKYRNEFQQIISSVSPS